jgi:hypothetical protein
MVCFYVFGVDLRTVALPCTSLSDFFLYNRDGENLQRGRAWGREVDPRRVYVTFVVDKITLQQGFPQVLRFSLAVSIHLILTSIYTLFLPKNKWKKRGNLPKSSALSQIGEQWIEKYFRSSSFLKRQCAVTVTCLESQVKFLGMCTTI